MQLNTRSKYRCNSLAELVSALKKYSTFASIVFSSSLSLLDILGSGDIISVFILPRILICQYKFMAVSPGNRWCHEDSSLFLSEVPVGLNYIWQ